MDGHLSTRWGRQPTAEWGLSWAAEDHQPDEEVAAANILLVRQQQGIFLFCKVFFILIFLAAEQQQRPRKCCKSVALGPQSHLVIVNMWVGPFSCWLAGWLSLPERTLKAEKQWQQRILHEPTKMNTKFNQQPTSIYWKTCSIHSGMLLADCGLKYQLHIVQAATPAN